jgi:hypothetical protein
VVASAAGVETEAPESVHLGKVGSPDVRLEGLRAGGPAGGDQLCRGRKEGLASFCIAERTAFKSSPNLPLRCRRTLSGSIGLPLRTARMPSSVFVAGTGLHERVTVVGAAARRRGMVDPVHLPGARTFVALRHTAAAARRRRAPSVAGARAAFRRSAKRSPWYIICSKRRVP